MKYVKSVYPKWTEDLKKWGEMKKHPHGNVQRDGPDLHSTPSRNFHSHTDFERSPYRSVADSSRYYQGSSEHPRDRKTYATIEKKWTILWIEIDLIEILVNIPRAQ